MPAAAIIKFKVAQEHGDNTVYAIDRDDAVLLR